MSTMVGADIDQLRELAATFNARAAQLKSIESQLNWRIHSAPWEGQDVSRFVQDWNTKHRCVITSAAVSISSAAHDLLAHADQQEQASTAGFTGAVASVVALRLQESLKVASNGGSLQSQLGAAGSDFFHVVKNVHGVTEKAAKAADAFLRGRRVMEVVQRWGGTLTTRSLYYAAMDAQKVVKDTNFFHAFAGKVLGPIGVALDVMSVAENLNNEQYDKAAISGVSAGLGVAATLVAFGAITGPAAPIVIGAAAVWAVGSLAYEHREQLGKAAGWVAERANEGVKTVVKRAENLVNATNRTIDQVTDTAKDFIKTVTIPLRSVFG